MGFMRRNVFTASTFLIVLGGLAAGGEPSQVHGTGQSVLAKGPSLSAAGQEARRSVRREASSQAGIAEQIAINDPTTTVGSEAESIELPTPSLQFPEDLSGDYDHAPSCDCQSESCLQGECFRCNAVCVPLCLRFKDLSVRIGAQGFTGPLNAGMDGSFGGMYGLNWGAPVPWLESLGLGMQLGANGIHSNGYGTSYSASSRDQFYLTTGLFRRVDWGWQSGVVVDYLHEHWFYSTDMVQARGELSWKTQSTGELGFWFTASDRRRNISGVVTPIGGTQAVDFSESISPIDMYSFFYRRSIMQTAGEVRLSAGWTGDSRGLLGADLSVPISPRLAMESNFLVLLPGQRDHSTRNEQETWNFGISLVWYPGASSQQAMKSYYRPLLEVADNGRMILGPR